jgi:hypothetical protein
MRTEQRPSRQLTEDTWVDSSSASKVRCWNIEHIYVCIENKILVQHRVVEHILCIFLKGNN